MKHKYIYLLVLLLIITHANAQPDWPEPTSESKPWTRWWWPGNAVDKENISQSLKEFHNAGIGGVEITPIYGVKGEEDRFIEYLSPEFSEILKYTIEEAHKLGMGVDLPPGSGWRCGGPFVPREKGLWELEIEKILLKTGEKLNWPENEAKITAATFVSEKGKSIVIQPYSDYKPTHPGTIYLALRVKSGDKVKRAADGGKGWAIDTFNKEITNWYLNEFWKRLNIEEGKLRCFFHDSFEYTGDFTTDFLTEFKKRRGYDLANYLHVLAGDCDDPEQIARVKSDYRETLSDLVYDSFIAPMTEWANGHQSLNRNQAHGSPGNILDLYAACDIPETEIFRTVEPGSVDVFVNKFASSAAHVTGQKLVSSESFTWLDEHWTVTTSDMVRATNRFFLAGVNHMFFHGTCYSPEDAEWPGWLFYASTQYNSRNPLWRQLPALNKYIERCQSVLQQAEPENDLLIYWPYYDVSASEGRIFNHLGVNKDAGWFVNHPISGLSKSLMNAGYSFDYISDKQLLNCKTKDGKIITSGNTAYKAVVVPKTSYIPLETMQKLKQFIDVGGKIYFDEQLPENVPGMFQLKQREKQLENIKQIISKEKNVGNIPALLSNAGINSEKSILDNGFQYVKMNLGNEKWYLVFNTGTEMLDKTIQLNTDARSYLIYDPMNGKINQPWQQGNSVHVQLEPERAVFIRCSDKKENVPEFVYENNSAKSITVEGIWKIRFSKGGPVYPGDISTKKLRSWTEMGDSQTTRFAGTAIYEAEFNWNKESDKAILNIGEVKDCARVKLNGKDCGVLLGPTYKLKVDNLKPGKNSLEVGVTNVAANRIRDLDKRDVYWKKFYDINFVNIEYEPFDASGWEIKEAGLMGPVTLKPVSN
ncbi:MAG TPA: glycosyl hydrolase [Prolixibacteraceae bacterium]|nr:glycosyl hydrolase [Prolixibacteraceae bacterium]